MEPLKQQILNDLSVFLNFDDFAEDAEIEGRIVRCVIENDIRAEDYLAMGVYGGALRVYAKPQDLPPRRFGNSTIILNGKIYSVISWESNSGLDTITLHSVEGM